MTVEQLLELGSKLGGTLDWFGTNWQTVITLIFSAMVALYTRQSSRLNQRLVMLQDEPNLSVFLTQHRSAFGYFDLVITNVGNGPARNIRFVISGLEMSVPEMQKLQNRYMMQKGLPYLVPGQRIEIALGKYDSLVEHPFNIDVTYSTDSQHYRSRIRTTSFAIDVSIFDGMHQVGTPTDQVLAQSMKQLSEDVRKIRTGSFDSRIKVDVRRRYLSSAVLDRWRTYWFGHAVIDHSYSPWKYFRNKVTSTIRSVSRKP